MRRTPKALPKLETYIPASRSSTVFPSLAPTILT